MKKSDIRYRIDTLLKCARITTNETYREEWIVEVVNLLNQLNAENDVDNDSCIKEFMDKYVTITDGSVGKRTKRLDVWRHYNYCVQKYGLPYITKNYFYKEVRSYNIPEGKSDNGRDYFGLICKYGEE